MKLATFDEYNDKPNALEKYDTAVIQMEEDINAREEREETLHLAGKAKVPTICTDRSSTSTVEITINDDLIS